MSKERRTVSLEPDVHDFLSKEGVNASQLVNKLVKNHATAGGDERAMLELRAEQLRSDINELETRTQTKQDELDKVEERLSEYRTERNEIIVDAADALSDVSLDAENPAIQNWAEKADMGVDEFITALEREQDCT